jgi:VWFA-related protein
MDSKCALPMRFLLAAALAGWTALAQQASSSAPPAQQAAKATPQESSIPLFRSRVHRVILDVVVTDSNEKPVRGLTRDDFTVAEDGKTQRVLSFDVHDFDAVAETPKVPELPANTFMNVPPAPERGPLYVILYDMVNMKVDDQGPARVQLLKFIADKPEGARFAIFVLSDGLRMVQGFTADRERLFSAVDPKTPRPHVPKVFLYGENNGQGDFGVLRWAFLEISHFLDSLPGRKNVMWFTGSLSASFLPGADSTSATTTAGNGPTPESISYNDEVKELVDAMARSQVSIYPVDVRGVVQTHVKSNPGGQAHSDSAELYATYTVEDDIARATGGHAFYSRNDLKDSLQQATETGGNYYTLSYSPSNQNYDGQVRKLRVELSKRGYHLAYRQAYCAYNPDFPPPPRGKHPATGPVAPKDSLFANMQHGAPLNHQLLFKVHVHPVGFPARATPEQMASLIAGQPQYFRERGKRKSGKPILPIELQTYAIDYTVEVDHPRGMDPRTQPFRMEVAAAAFDADGVMLNGNVENAAEAFTMSPGEGMQPADYSPAEPVTRRFHRAQQLFDVPVSAKSMRIAVRDVTTDRVGAMEVPLPLGREPETEADAPMSSDSPASSEAQPPKPN